MIDPGFTTVEMEAMFSPKARVAAMLRFESALALALADTGLAPTGEAEAVARACVGAEIADPDQIFAATWSEGTPVNALLGAIRPDLSDVEARWLHYGATTQDTVDTATMLLARDGLDVLDRSLCGMARHLSRLVSEHRDLPQMGRTFLQHARPTTFGMRMAGWLHSVLDHITTLRQKREGLVIQLGGPVGDLASYGDRALEVVNALARQLGLGAPPLPWHNDRTRIADVVSSIEQVARTMARIGVDVALLSSSEIGEIRVRAGGSSSMPAKKNPIDSIRAVAAAEACSGAASMVTAGRPHELDRGIGGWHVEWLAVPLVFSATAAAVEAMTICMETLEVDSARMAANLGELGAPHLDKRLIDRVLADYTTLVDPT